MPTRGKTRVMKNVDTVEDSDRGSAGNEKTVQVSVVLSNPFLHG